METKTINQVIEEAKKIRFADPIKKKSGDVYRVAFTVDYTYNINGVVKYTTGVNVNPNIKNSYLKEAYIISAGTSTQDDVFIKRYLH